MKQNKVTKKKTFGYMRLLMSVYIYISKMRARNRTSILGEWIKKLSAKVTEILKVIEEPQ